MLLHSRLEATFSDGRRNLRSILPVFLSAITMFAFGSPSRADDAAGTGGNTPIVHTATLHGKPTADATNDSILTRPLQLASARETEAAAPLGFGGGGGGKLPVVGHIVPLSLRLGAQISPRTRFVGGVDYTLPSFGTNFNPRIDLEAIVSANFGGVSTLVPLTFNIVYSKGLVSGTRVYGGAGIGPYFGEVTRFGGKIFVGADFTSRLSGEVDVHFAGTGDPLVNLMVRVPL